MVDSSSGDDDVAASILSSGILYPYLPTEYKNWDVKTDDTDSSFSGNDDDCVTGWKVRVEQKNWGCW